MKLKNLLLPSLAVGAATFFVVPKQSEGYVLFGSTLGLGQRDVRIFNNFEDNAANNNNTPQANFPGYQGASMAVWKAVVEWGSEFHGNGQGDPYQGNLLGSGGANFDPTWQGEALGVGGTNNNIHSALSGGNGGVFAFAEGPYSNGWRCRYYESWTWSDGPGTGGGTDLQGIAAHEYGHCIGLGHSGTGSATMGAGAGSGLPERSLHPDDAAGIQAAYGVKSADKPKITGISMNPDTGILVIFGEDFAATGNEIWFTQLGKGGNGTPVKLINIASDLSGTEITVGVPNNAGPGDVLVRRPGSAHDDLSNAWPIDPGNEIEPPSGPSIATTTPSTIDAVRVDDAAQVTITGNGFTGLTGVLVDGEPLENFPPEFSLISDSQIQILEFPLVTTIGPVDIEIEHPLGNAVTQVTIQTNDPPVVELAGSQPAFLFTFGELDITMGSDVGDVVFLQFSGDDTPSTLPGFVDFDIGNNFSTLFSLGTYVVDISGYARIVFPLASPTLAGVTIHVQAAVLDASPGVPLFPLMTTNVQTGLFLF